jgi:hypothetical protein
MRERKDRLVQTRVPERLETTLRHEADKKGTTVSQLIRNVLEEAFEFVDGVAENLDQIVTDSVELAHRITDVASHRSTVRRERHRRCGPPLRGAEKKLADVAAWQEVLLNKDVRCARCGAALKKGSRALHGLHGKTGKAPAWLCPGGFAA